MKIILLIHNSINTLNVSPRQGNYCNTIIIFPVIIIRRTSQQVVVSIKDVIAKCVYMGTEAQMGQVFISLLPNATELE